MVGTGRGGVTNWGDPTGERGGRGKRGEKAGEGRGWTTIKAGQRRAAQLV